MRQPMDVGGGDGGARKAGRVRVWGGEVAAFEAAGEGRLWGWDGFAVIGRGNVGTGGSRYGGQNFTDMLSGPVQWYRRWCLGRFVQSK